jgi:hypothetical protein
MSPGAARKSPDIKDRCRKFPNAPDPGPVFLKISKFTAHSFSVRVRHLRQSPTRPASPKPGTNGLPQQGILQSRRRIKINPVDVIPNSPIVLPPFYDEIEIKWS